MKHNVNAPLDPAFEPMILVYEEFEEKVKAIGGNKIKIAVERNKGYISTFEMLVYPDGTVIDGVAISSTIKEGFENAGYEIVNAEYLDDLLAALPQSSGGMGGGGLLADAALTEEQVAADAALHMAPQPDVTVVTPPDAVPKGYRPPPPAHPLSRLSLTMPPGAP